MKKNFLSILVFSLALLLVGCGSEKTKEDTFKKHNKDNNALECTAKDDKNVATMYIYFNKDNKVTTLDYYLEVEADGATKAEVKKAEEMVCEGQGQFKKEWIEECSYELDENIVKAHVYLNNADMLGGYENKEDILNLGKEGLSGYTCIDKK